ncbi:MAG: L,D-transpeptidase family protein [Frankiales bacterium]|nr:L,D-transpeptidase family protein [Frankiales bacterium]
MRRTTTARTTLAVALLAGLAALPAAPAAGVAPASAPGRAATSAAAATRAAAVVPAVVYAPAIPGAAPYRGIVRADVRKVIVVTAASTRSTVALLTLYRRSGAGWHRVSTWPARLGYGGLVPGWRRVQGTGTTPEGSFAITTAFGRRANPGTSMPYTKVTDDDWWVEDRTSAYYNQMRRASQGGFHVTTHGYNGSEHLARMGSQYDYVAVVDFNRPHPVIGRGAGIFLHAFGRGATAGCVSIQWAHMRQVLQWLHPGDNARIIIGTRAFLAG